MKSVLVVVFALCVVASAYPRPAHEESKEDDDSSDSELFVVPLERAPPRRPAFGFSIRNAFAPHPFESHPFFRTSPWDQPPASAGGSNTNDFMTQMQEMLNEMRKQLTEILQHTHGAGAGALPDGDTSVGTRIGEDDLPKNKSTSTTKVIDGHVVTVNETTYSSGDDNIGAVFRIKVVEVKPSESPEDEGETEDKSTEDKSTEEEVSTNGVHSEPEPTTSKSELVEDNHEETNEIPNQKVGSEVDDLNA